MFTAFLDANVLVPIALCDVILRTAEQGIFRPLWSQKVTDEACAAISRIHPELSPARVRMRFFQMNKAFPDSMVEAWESLQNAIVLPDDDDRHVVAAAKIGGADVIVTRNMKDFPVNELSQHGLEAVSPEDFLLDMLDLSPERVEAALRAQVAATTRPSLTMQQVLADLERAGVPKFAQSVREAMELPVSPYLDKTDQAAIQREL